MGRQIGESIERWWLGSYYDIVLILAPMDPSLSIRGIRTAQTQPVAKKTTPCCASVTPSNEASEISCLPEKVARNLSDHGGEVHVGVGLPGGLGER